MVVPSVKTDCVSDFRSMLNLSFTFLHFSHGQRWKNNSTIYTMNVPMEAHTLIEAYPSLIRMKIFIIRTKRQYFLYILTLNINVRQSNTHWRVLG